MNIYEVQVVQARASIVSAHLKHSGQSLTFRNFSHNSLEMTFLLSFNQNSRSLIKYSISGYRLVYHSITLFQCFTGQNIKTQGMTHIWKWCAYLGQKDLLVILSCDAGFRCHLHDDVTFHLVQTAVWLGLHSRTGALMQRKQCKQETGNHV